MSDPTPELASLLLEERWFPPSESFVSTANVRDPGVHARAAADPEGFWASFARELEWMKPWDEVLEWNPPDAKWFLGGKLNVSQNCLDRHVDSPRRHKAAIVFEGEPGEVRT